MANVTINAPRSNVITRSVEGFYIWDTHTLKYTNFSDDSFYSNIIDAYLSFSAERLIYNGSSYDVMNSKLIDFIRDDQNALIYQSVVNAFDAYSNIINMSFKQSDYEDDADLNILGYKFPNDIDNHVTWGSSEHPAENYSKNIYESYLLFQTNYSLNTPEKGGGGYFNIVALHEVGYALGLSKTYTQSNNTTILDGEYRHLNRLEYSVMSYQDRGVSKNYRNYGYNLTPMAIDIAALQNMYGANKKFNNGHTTYTLNDARKEDYDIDGSDNNISIGRALYCIWDSKGTDALSYKGTQSVYLNLNSATLSLKRGSDITNIVKDIKGFTAYQSLDIEIRRDLEYTSYHAGGFLSQTFNRQTKKASGSGYTIAKGVTIEKAIGGGGSDLLIGNRANNILYGNGGHDIIHGSEGNDIIYGGSGNDRLFGGSGKDIFYADSGTDWIYGGTGFDTVDYTKMKTAISINLAKNIYKGSASGDRFRQIEQINATAYNDYVAGTNNKDAINGYNGNDKLYGLDGNDKLAGGKGNDRLTGGRGADTLYGSSGKDYFYYNRTLESTHKIRDTIKDFEHGKDKLFLTFDVDKADLAIQAIGSYNLVKIIDTDFEVRVNKNITLADIVIV